ncbi:MAG: hypothetical protein AB7P50_22500 [Alphaproteobacteria bacterium]
MGESLEYRRGPAAIVVNDSDRAELAKLRARLVELHASAVFVVDRGDRLGFVQVGGLVLTFWAVPEGASMRVTVEDELAPDGDDAVVLTVEIDGRNGIAVAGGPIEIIECVDGDWLRDLWLEPEPFDVRRRGFDQSDVIRPA